MPEQIDVQAVIDQLMTRIAQLELEVAVLKAMGTPKMGGSSFDPSIEVAQDNPEPPSAGYM